MPPVLAEDVQRAAAYVAARSRGDQEAARALIRAFEDDLCCAHAFAALAELTIGLLAKHDSEPLDRVAARLALTLAHF